ncbi:MAG: FxLYD domain-containing protein [Anaerolineae bacterium]
MKRIVLPTFITTGLIALLLLFPAGAQQEPRAFLPFVARDVSPGSWPAPPTPTTPVTPSPADVRIVSSSSFTQTIGAETFLFIVGEVGNAGPATVRDLGVIAALLDDDGELIEHATEPAYQTILGPGELTPFRIMLSVPAGYASHSLYLDYEPTSEGPLPQVTPSATNTYVDESSGWQYFLGEVVNGTDVDMAGVRAVVTLYDAFGDVLNVVDSGRGASSLYEDVIGVGQKRPLRAVLRYGPRDYARLRWQVAYRPADRPAPVSLPVQVGHIARGSGTLRDENGDVIGVTQWLDIYGEVENTTSGPIRAVRAFAAFYDNDGEVTNAGLVQSLHGRLGVLAPGERTPFHLNISSGQIPDVDTSRFVGVTYAPADGTWQDQIHLTTQRAYLETRSVLGIPVEWLNVVGEARNDGGEPAQDVRVVATFYDAEGRVVNAMAGQVFRLQLPAGGTSPFKIRTASGPLAYDHFSLGVISQPSQALEPAGLVVDVSAPAAGAMPAIFQGEVTNESGETRTEVAVFVALYDTEGQILVAESQVVAEEMAAGDSTPFALRVEQGPGGWHTYDIGANSN